VETKLIGQKTSIFLSPNANYFSLISYICTIRIYQIASPSAIFFWLILQGPNSTKIHTNYNPDFLPDRFLGEIVL